MNLPSQVHCKLLTEWMSHLLLNLCKARVEHPCPMEELRKKNPQYSNVVGWPCQVLQGQCCVQRCKGEQVRSHFRLVLHGILMLSCLWRCF